MDAMSMTAYANESLSWLLVYTKARAETWTGMNLRNQGFTTLMPRIASRGGFPPLFPRYVFVGAEPGMRTDAIGNTLGVQYVVCCGVKPARIPTDVIAEIHSRMNANGVVQLEERPAPDSLFQVRGEERNRALVKLTEAGYRLKSA